MKRNLNCMFTRKKLSLCLLLCRFLGNRNVFIKKRPPKCLNTFEVKVVWYEPKLVWQIDSNTRIISTDISNLFQ